MAEDKNTSQVNMKIPGMKGGPRNRGAAVEKPVNGKETFMRLMQYFAKEIPVIIALFIKSPKIKSASKFIASTGKAIVKPMRKTFTIEMFIKRKKFSFK